MRSERFRYDLPPDCIAQAPVEPRDVARLLVFDRASGALDDRHVLDLPTLLDPGDLVVLNDSRVIPARLPGRKAGSGGGVEGLFLRPLGSNRWEVLLRPGRRLRSGTRILFDHGTVVGEVVGRLPEGGWELHVKCGGDLPEILERVGFLPLPPYIRAMAQAGSPLAERYQTVFARRDPGHHPEGDGRARPTENDIPWGSVAAPTAGLHFTPELFGRLEEAGVRWTTVTLHVGWGTFRPVRAEEIEAHTMHPEWFTLPEATARAVAETRARGGRVVAVGTTTCRVLEQCATDGRVEARSGWTRLFITPGHRFRCVDILLTNFHLPGTTLLMLVTAFAGLDPVLLAYREAIRRGYRFYSFGDAMLIL